MRFHPRRWSGVVVGGMLLSTLIALEVWIGRFIAERTPDLLTFLAGLAGVLMLPVLALLVYCMYGLLSLTYDLNRDRLLIRWAGLELVVPLDHITAVVRGRHLDRPMNWRGIRWPGHVIGRAETARVGPLLSLATAPLDRQLLLVTSSGAYGVSPASQRDFLAGLEVRRQMGSLRALPEEARLPPMVSWSAWRDRILWSLVLVGALVNALLFAYLCWRFAGLPSFLAVHFDPLGQPDRIGDRAELFRLPLIGLIVWALNTSAAMVLPAWLRSAGYLLLAGAIVVQALLAVGLLAVAR